MIQIMNNDVMRGGEKIGWVRENDVYDQEGRKLGYYTGNDVFTYEGRKVAWIEGNKLWFTSTNSFMSLEELNKEIQGGSLGELARAAIRLFLGN